MYLIVGLGNPGREYEMTRHNIGFEVIDYLAGEYKFKVNKLKFKGLYGEYFHKGEKLIFLKPQTYMNLSGDSVAEFKRFFNIPPQNILVICDDTALERGRIRLRQKGSAGGHNGLKSIILRLGTEEFPRARIGIGSPENGGSGMVDFVIGRFTKEDIPILENAIENTAKAVFDFVDNGIEHAMNGFNAKK